MMKTRIALLTAAVTPLISPLRAQEPAAAAAGGSAAADPFASPVRNGASKRIPRIQFQDASLQEIVEYLQKKMQDGAGGAVNDPEGDDFNVVIVPGGGIAERRVPSLSLRNVTPADALTVATTILGLVMEPVRGEQGRTVAWMVRDPNQAVNSAVAADKPVAGAIAGGVIGNPVIGVVPGTIAGNAIGGLSGGPPTGGAGAQSGPVAVELASSGLGGGAFGGPPQKEVRVFGIAPLIASVEVAPEQRAKARSEKYRVLQETFTGMATDQMGRPPEIRFYEAMDIMVVKGDDPATMTLVADAVEAMKANARSGVDTARGEIEVLKNQLALSRAELEMTRRTFADQLEALKAAGKKNEH